MLSVGIDPSLKGTGLVCLVDHETTPRLALHLTPIEGPLIRRIHELRSRVVMGINDVRRTLPVGAGVMVCIEGYAKWSLHDPEPLVGLGTAIRLMCLDMGWPYVEPTPSQVQAYVQFAIPSDCKGKAKGLKKNAKRVKPHAEVKAHWGFEHESGDVVDAYVMAQIALRSSPWRPLRGAGLKPYQIDVLHKLSAAQVA